LTLVIDMVNPFIGSTRRPGGSPGSYNDHDRRGDRG
jgi:hypothetical protein